MRPTEPLAGPDRPIDLADSSLPDWDPSARREILCRHLLWGGPPAAPPIPQTHAGPAEAPADRGWQWRPWSAVRWVYRRVWRRLPDSATQRIARVKALIFYLAGRSPKTGARLATGRPTPREILKDLARVAYRRHLRRWIDPEAVARHRRDREPVPVAPLALGGLVFASVLDPLDPRQNPRDLLTAFLLAFRRRPDATLVLKLDGPWRAALSAVREAYLRLKLDHDCRVAVIADDLDAAGMDVLLRATTYHVDASRFAPSAGPLRLAMASGRPVIAPDHSAFAGLVDDRVGFVVGTHPEPAPSPHAPGTTWNRLVWTDLRAAFLAAAALAGSDPAAYRAMAAEARRRAGEDDGSEGVVPLPRAAKLARAS